MTLKRSIDVEKLLHWAYRDELPKREGGATALFEFGALGGVAVDRSHDEASLPAALGNPSPDAFVVERAVKGLDDMVDLAWPRDRGLLAPEFGAVLGDRDVGLSLLHVPTSVYVAHHGRMGNRPEWEVKRWRLQRQIAGNGKIRVAGLGSGRRWKDGAYCPLSVDPDPRSIVHDRAIYVAWHAALMRLAASLGDSLALWIVEPPAASPVPWIIPDPQVRILPDLSKSAASRPIGRSGASRAA